MKKIKLVVFGTGLLGKEWSNEIFELDNIQIIAYVDNNPEKWGTKFLGYPVYEPVKVKELDYDYLFVAVTKDTFDSVFYQLRDELHVPHWKIVNYGWLVSIIQKKNRELFEYNKLDVIEYPKVYDCFTFYNELELLEIRLEMMNPYVDYFVLVEMEKTQMGEDKELYFEKNKERFNKYKDKIIHIKVEKERIPEYDEKNARNGVVWTLENFQRNAIVEGLQGCCKPDDIVIISDLDEIPNPKYLKIIKESRIGIKASNIYVNTLEYTAIAMKQQLFVFYFNNRGIKEWYGSVIVRYKNMVTPQFLRYAAKYLPYIPDGGWHFTWFGDVKRIENKIKSVCETGCYSEVTHEKVVECLKTGKFLIDYFECERVDKTEIGLENIDELIDKYPKFWLDV